MTHPEHTPQDTRIMREAAADPRSPHTQDTTDSKAKTPPDSPQPHDTHMKDIHHYTIPNREDGHYQNSPLFRDIVQNPALYMDRADF